MVNKAVSVLFVFLSVSAATWINDTRSSVLRIITEWINSNDGECIFWPNGMASFGKTRTARIIAERNRENGRSCSAVSFSPIDDKHASDHFRVFTTLAYRLARHHPKIRIALANMIQASSDYTNHPLRVH